MGSGGTDGAAGRPKFLPAIVELPSQQSNHDAVGTSLHTGRSRAAPEMSLELTPLSSNERMAMEEEQQGEAAQEEDDDDDPLAGRDVPEPDYWYAPAEGEGEGDQKGPSGAGWDEEAGGGGGDGGWGNNYGEEWTQNQYAVTGTQAEPGYEKDMPPNIIKCTASRELLFRAREFPVELQEQFFQGAYVRLCTGAGYSGTGTDKEWVKKYLVCRIVRFEKAPDSEAPYSVKIQQGSQKFVKEGIRTRIVVSCGNLQIGYKLSSVSSEPILPREWRNLSLYSAMVDKKEAEAALASGEDLETITIKKHRPHSWSEMDLKDLEVIAARLEMAHHYSFGDEQINKMVGDRMGNASIRFRCLQSDAD